MDTSAFAELCQFQPTLPARGATVRGWCVKVLAMISTHAPRTGSDHDACILPDSCFRFQPTLPARGATEAAKMTMLRMLAISTHAPRTGSDRRYRAGRYNPGRFQPTLPARGATDDTGRGGITPEDFNPRSPHGERRTPPCAYRCQAWYFNPRSPHGERRLRRDAFPSGRYFNPRSPHGERPSLTFPVQTSWTFQPTLPARGATDSTACKSL